MSHFLRKHPALFLLTLCAILFVLPGFSPASEISPAAVKARSAASAVAVAPGESVTIKILVTLEAPVVARAPERPPVSVSLVIDRSGSMEEAKKLDYAIRAGKTLVRALDARDRFGLVIYDHRVQVLRPLAPLRDKEKVLTLLDGIKPGGRTFLSGGLEAGIGQLVADKSENVRRVVLLSDGLANEGVTNGELVAAIGAKARKRGLGVSTVGLGLDYDESLMQLLAQRGGGQYYYVKDSEDLPAVFRQELALATDTATRGLSVVFTPSGAVRGAKIFGYSTREEGSSRRIEMNDLYAGEKRQIMLYLTLTPQAEAKEQQLGELDLAYADAADGQERNVRLPLVLAVEADPATRQSLNDKEQKNIALVEEESLLLDAEEAHVAAMVALEANKPQEARQILAQSKSRLVRAAPAPSPAIANKIVAMEEDEKNLDVASHDEQLQKSMSKRAKSSAYQSAQGGKQGLMLQKGDKGFMVEKLQNALAGKGFYKGDITGAYDAALEEAVKAFQRSNALDADGIAGQATQNALGM